MPLGQALGAEFLGTLILCFSQVTNASIIAPLGIASALMIGVYSFAPISGANFNPAVSFGLAVSGSWNHGSMKWKQAFQYIGVQLLGGLVAAVVGGYFRKQTMSSPDAMLKNDWWEVLVGELVYTLMLVFVVLNVATLDSKKNNNYFGLAIGMVVLAGVVAVGNISGSWLNPAVSFAAGLASLIYGWDNAGHAIGWWALCVLGELLGALLACVLFFVIRKDEFEDEYREAPVIAHGAGVKFAAECMGTFYLFLSVSLGIMQGIPLACVGIGAALMCMIYALGDVSGANFNPAVSTGLLVCGKLDIQTYALYWAAQLFGGLWAAYLAIALRDGTVVNVPLSLTTDMSPPIEQVCLAEFFYTFVLVLVVIHVAVRNAPNDYFGLAIGFVIVVGAADAGYKSGAMFNPVVTLFLALQAISWQVPSTNTAIFLLYMLVQIVAGAVAGLVSMWLGLGTEKRQLIEEEEP